MWEGSGSVGAESATLVQTILVGVVVAAALAACSPRTKLKPGRCETNTDCGQAETCNTTTYQCESIDGGSGGRGGKAGTGGTGGGLPIGGTTGSGGMTDAGAGTGGAPASDGGGDRPADAGTEAGTDAVSICPPCTGATPLCDTAARKCVACLQSSHCTGTKPVCDTATGTCVGCLATDQCTGTTPVCETATHTCVGCLQSSQCTAAKPICNTTSKTCGACTASSQCMTATPTTPVCRPDGTCAECNMKSDCAAKADTPACFEGKCVACTLDSECPAGKPICNTMSHTCVGCTGDAQCMTKNAQTPACVMATGPTQGTCVACTAHSYCTQSATKPACIANVCSACTSDKQCAEKAGADPGVCMFHTDGHCATATEVLYVKPAAGCDDFGSGSASAPFCQTQPAVTAATAAKNVIVVRKGTSPLNNWSFGGTTPIAVIGQGGATIGPGAGIGIAITGGDVYIRGLAVSGWTGVGISVAAGATIELDQCIVTGNAGGLAVNGGGFEINNSVFAVNAPATVPAAFAGVYLKGAAAMPTQFRNNTVYGNMGDGLVCAGAYLVQGLLLANNTGLQITACNFDLSSLVASTGPIESPFDTDPTRPYRLSTTTTVCVERGNTTDFSNHDLDGNPRPSMANGRPDCGAHELHK